MATKSGLEADLQGLKLLETEPGRHDNDEAKDANTLLALVNEKILSKETCSSWLQKIPPIPPKELQNILTTYTRSFEDFAQHADENESDLKYAAVETISKRCVQAYILILQKEYDEVASILLEAGILTKHCVAEKYVSKDYVDGFKYVFETLKILCALEKNKTDSEATSEKLDWKTLQGFLDTLNGFEELSVKNKVGVLALKMYFLGKVIRGRTYQQQIDIILQMIEMDPGNCEWRGCLYFLSKFQRVAIDPYSPPSEQEKGAILDAVRIQELSGDELDSRILIGQIICLAEILRNQLKNAWNGSLRFGAHLFNSAEEVVQFIKSEAEKIVSIDPMSIRSNVNLAKIFSSILPHAVQDRDFAQTCIERAVKFYPNSSKTNHRMGVFFLFSNTQIPKALVFIKKAYETDKRNILALLDLLHIYMGDVDKNDDELKATFDEALNSSFFQSVPQNYSDLLFTKGVYEYLKGRSHDSVNLMLKAHLVNEKITKNFQDIYKYVKRFKWYQNVNGSNILIGMQQLLFSEFIQCTNNAVRSQLENLSTAAKEAQEAYENNLAKSRLSGSSRGGTSQPGIGSRGRGRGRGHGHGLGPNEGQDSTESDFGNTFTRRGTTGRVNRGRPGRGDLNRRHSEREIEDEDWRNTPGTEIRGRGGRLSDGSISSRGSNNRGNRAGRRGSQEFRRNDSDNMNNNWRATNNQNQNQTTDIKRELKSEIPSGSASVPPSEKKDSSETCTQNENSKTGIVFRNTQKNHHETLGIAKTASKAEIKKAYLKLAKEYHPDRNTHLSEPEKLEKQKEMERINNALECLNRISN